MPQDFGSAEHNQTILQSKMLCSLLCFVPSRIDITHIFVNICIFFIKPPLLKHFDICFFSYHLNIFHAEGNNRIKLKLKQISALCSDGGGDDVADAVVSGIALHPT